MNKRTREPLFHITKRAALPWWAVWAIRGGALLAALIVCGVITSLVTGENPFQVYAAIYKGSFGTARKLWVLLQNIAMLLCVSLAVTPAFRMRCWNLGGEGQALAGALAAAACMICLRDKLPNGAVILLMIVTSILAGAIWAGIPAFFKARFNTNETLFTLMMNYIAIGIVRWLQGGPWEGRPGTQIIPMFKDNARLPNVFGIYCGWIIVLVMVVIVHIYMNYTKHGYEVAVIGDSINTARYAGMNVGWVMMRTMLFSGAICGCVGWMLVSGANGTLNADVAGGMGFTAITVAWLSQLNCFAMIIIASILAIIGKGSATLQTKLNVPASVADIVSGILLFCMLGCEFFINYKMVFRGKKEVKA